MQLEMRRTCRSLTASLQTRFTLAKARAMPEAALSQELFVGTDLGHGFLGEIARKGFSPLEPTSGEQR